MLEARDLEVHRGGRAVLRNLNLRLHAGEVVGVLGPNGAGKSSLVQALSGERATMQGEVLLHGKRLADWPAVARARQLAVLPQQSALGFAFEVREVVMMGRLPHATGRRVDGDIVDLALEAADVQHLKARSYLALSGGERQRVHLARVLAQLWPAEPGRVLMLDEPTSALDPLHQHGILNQVRAFAQAGAAVLVVLHDLNLAARFCDRLLILKEGESVCLARPWEALQASRVADVFGLDVLVQAHPERGHPLVVVR